ncbi:MAG TPA: TlpA disulfide reductase family protein [Nocardioides sp.]|nr:TlpA disulfide reductase family protein [Nocardioides sp.]
MRSPLSATRVRKLPVALLLAGSLVAAALTLGACSSSPAPPDGVPTTADTAPCPRGQGREVSELPRLTLDCLTGPGTVAISRLHGKPEIINIWASWCAPCREEMPMLERAHHRLGDRVQFLGVDVKDSRSAAQSFLTKHGIGYAQVFDSHGDLPLRLRLQGVPNTLFVDASGNVVDRVIGRLDDQSLAEGISRLQR